MGRADCRVIGTPSGGEEGRWRVPGAAAQSGVEIHVAAWTPSDEIGYVVPVPVANAKDRVVAGPVDRRSNPNPSAGAPESAVRLHEERAVRGPSRKQVRPRVPHPVSGRCEEVVLSPAGADKRWCSHWRDSI